MINVNMFKWKKKSVNFPHVNLTYLYSIFVGTVSGSTVMKYSRLQSNQTAFVLTSIYAIIRNYGTGLRACGTNDQIHKHSISLV